MYIRRINLVAPLIMVFIVGCSLLGGGDNSNDAEKFSYTISNGQSLYFIIHNFTYTDKTLYIWGSNTSKGDWILKTAYETLDNIEEPFKGLPQSARYYPTKGDWRTKSEVFNRNLTFTYGSSTPIGYGRNPSNWTIGVTKMNFWVYNAKNNKYSNITGTLYAIGTNMTIGSSPVSVEGGVAYIFVDDNDWNKNVSPHVITQLAVSFNGENGIYAKTTNVLGGTEDGGGYTGDGGVDGNKNIYILLHDIQDNYDVNNKAFIAGYYSPVNDFPTNYDGETMYSSMKQMFVIDTYPTLQKGVGLAISTLIHEYQHMVNFGQKYFLGGTQEELWLNEACSMALEDVLNEFVPVSNKIYNNGGRMSYFLSKPEMGLFTWKEDNNIIYEYGKAYAYMAFLCRNTSPKILREIVSGVGKNRSGEAAINSALSALGEQKSLKDTVRLWQRALIYNDTSLSSPWRGYKTNATVSGYELVALDVNTYNNAFSGKGPVFYYFRSSKTSYTLPPYSTIIFKATPSQGEQVTIYISKTNNIEIEGIIK